MPRSEQVILKYYLHFTSQYLQQNKFISKLLSFRRTLLFFFVIHKIEKEKRNFFLPLRFMTFSNPYRKLANSFLNCIKL